MTLPAAWIAAALMTAPLAWKLARLYRAGATHSFSGTPAFGDLLGSFIPGALAGSAAAGLLLAWLARRGTAVWENAPARRDAVALAFAWAVLPPLCCFGISVFTDVKIFVPRYYGSAIPGLALLAAWALSRVEGGARRTVAAAVVVGAILSYAAPSHGGEDWAGAMAAERAAAAPDTPVLMASGFVEGADPAALEDPALRGVLFAPLQLYSAAGRLVPLPFRLDEGSTAYAERALAGVTGNNSRFLFVGRWQGLTWEPWLRGRLAERGYRSRSLGAFGNVGVYLFSAP